MAGSWPTRPGGLTCSPTAGSGIAALRLGYRGLQRMMRINTAVGRRRILQSMQVFLQLLEQFGMFFLVFPQTEAVFDRAGILPMGSS